MHRKTTTPALIPPEHQVPVSAQVFNGAFVVLFAVGVAIGTAVYVLLQRGGSSEQRREEILRIAGDLRKLRVEAKAELLASTSECGTIPLSRSSGLQWWSVGPRDASVAVMLVAEDGDSASYWGKVFKNLATDLCVGGGIRVIAFHRSQTADRRTHSPLSLRTRDIRAVMDMVMSQRPVGVPRPSPEFVIVTNGPGVWGAITAAGAALTDAASESTLPQRVRGIISVSPVLAPSGPHTAWWDAARAASRVSESRAVSTVAAALAPPVRAGDASATTVSDVDVWAHRASRCLLLTESEQSLLVNIAPRLASPPGTVVEVITQGRLQSGLLQLPEVLAALEATRLIAANTVGSLFLNRDAAEALIRRADESLYTLTRELALQRPVASVDAKIEATGATEAESLPLMERLRDLAQGSAFHAASALSGSTFAGLAGDSSDSRSALATLPFALGLMTPPHFERTAAFRLLLNEYLQMPSFFRITLVDDDRCHSVLAGVSSTALLDLPLQQPSLVARRILSACLAERGNSGGSGDISQRSQSIRGYSRAAVTV
jgi:hypothetical protein